MSTYKTPWGCWSAGLQAEAEVENEHWEPDRMRRQELDAATPTLPEIKQALPAGLAKARYDRKLSTSLRKGMRHAFCYVRPVRGRMWQRREFATVTAALGLELDYDSAAFGFPVRYMKRGKA